MLHNGSKAFQSGVDHNTFDKPCSVAYLCIVFSALPIHSTVCVISSNMDYDSANKKHRAKHSGPKAKRKEAHKNDQSEAHNPKAFAVQHTTKAARLVQRTLDYQTRKQHLPQTKSTTEVSPPIIVAIVGPPKCGKSTLLKSLVRHFSHQSINVIQGPLTVVVGKKIRLTFIECGCDVNSMLDVAKIADVVLLLVNVRVGLEMYHFEFINMIQTHGLPRIIPVLNHIDTFKDSSASRARRRKIKQRLWVDLNSKIFLLTRFQPKKYFSGEQSVTTCEYSKPGEYLLAEVRRLARMIVVKIPQTTDWRTSHPYLLIDRLEDITEGLGSVTDSGRTDHHHRTVSMYGWVRGAPLPPALTSPGIQIAGLGEFTVANCSRQPDPCPLPCQLAAMEADGKVKTSRHLSDRDRKIYAPMSSLGGVLFDRDATYIDLGGSHYLTGGQDRKFKRFKHSQPPMATQSALDEAHSRITEAGGLDDQLENVHRIRIVGNAPFLLSEDLVADGGHDDGHHEVGDDEGLSDSTESDLQAQSVGGESDAQQPGEDKSLADVNLFSDEPFAGFLVPAGTQLREEPKKERRETVDTHKSPYVEAKKILDDIEWHRTTPSRVNWNQLVYGSGKTATPGCAEDFTIPPPAANQRKGDEETHADVVEPNQQLLDRFTTGKWDATEDAASLLHRDAEAKTMLKVSQERTHARASASRVQYRADGQLVEAESDEEADDDDDVGGSDSQTDLENLFHESSSDSMATANEEPPDACQKPVNDPSDEFEKSLLRPSKRQKLLEKRARHRELFNKLYDAAAGGSDSAAFYEKLVAARDKQLDANKAALQSLQEDAVEQLQGFAPGSYVRLELRGVPSQFIDRFDPSQPLVVGGLPSTEETKGYLQVRFRTHRWLKRVLKSADPICVSVGWRRYQTVAIYSKEEHNLRNRYLKYSLLHEHCLATIYGPLVPARTGVLFFVNSAWLPEQTANGGEPASGQSSVVFRIAGTGSVTTTDQSFQVMKKLKLMGEPFKIFSKTAFIRGMFNSSLEVSKMIGARIQTVSSIRGLIKAALTNPSTSRPGDFRATFEAPIRKADLVSLRTFVAVSLPKYYNPVLNRLCALKGDGQSSSGEEARWRLLRTLTELHRETGQRPEFRSDSQYKPIHRPVYVPTPLEVPTKLVASLPFANRPKPSRRAIGRQLRSAEADPVRAVFSVPLPEPVVTCCDDLEGSGSESRQALLHRLRLLHADFQQRQHSKMADRMGKYKKKLMENQERQAANEKRLRKRFFARGGGKRNEKSDNRKNQSD